MIQSKLPNVGTTIFTRMSQLAAECGAINLSQGFPDFDGPPELREAVGRHIAAGHNQYAPMTGLPALREQVAKKIEQFYGRRVSADSEVTITPGATEAIFSAIQALVHPGDEVVVLDPSYDSYEPSVQLAGGRCVHVPLALPDFSIDWQRMAEAIGPRTRLVIINTPHNPSGALISREELDRLAALIRDRDIYLISDEVYEHLVFDGVAHTSVLSHDELYPRSFVVSSFGKTYPTSPAGRPATWSRRRRSARSCARFTSTSTSVASRRCNGHWRTTWPAIRSTCGNCPASTRPSATCSATCCWTLASVLPVRRAPTSSAWTIRPSVRTWTTWPWPSG